MEQMGIGYGDLSAENNGLVMMSSQLMGSRGPWAAWSGYGPNTQVTGGMTHLWNYEATPEPAGSMSTSRTTSPDEPVRSPPSPVCSAASTAILGSMSRCVRSSRS